MIPLQLYARLKAERDFGSKFKKQIARREGIDHLGGMSQTSAEGTTHSVRKEEQVAFSNWINRSALSPLCSLLQNDHSSIVVFCAGTWLMTLTARSICLWVQRAATSTSSAMMAFCYGEPPDLSLACAMPAIHAPLHSPCSKMINKSQPGTIDERTLNKGKLSIYQIHENLTLARNSAEAIGCNIVNIGPEDLHQGKPHLVLGLLWQIIRIGLLSDINLHEHPGLANLLNEGETLDEFMKLSPEQILIRWVNYHLERSGCHRRVSNFQGDIKDSIPYIYLIKQIAPQDKGVNTLAEHVSLPHVCLHAVL